MEISDWISLGSFIIAALALIYSWYTGRKIHKLDLIIKKKEIEKRSKNPESYEKYISIKKKNSTYYRIYIRNYTIFYTVKNNIIEVRRILYSKRNFNNLV